MKITRHFTTPGIPVSNQIHWKRVTAEIPGTFKMENVEVPEHWSQNATNILAQKYFRKAGIPIKAIGGTFLSAVAEEGVPSWLLRSVPSDVTEYGPETSAKQVFHRLAGHWTYTGWKEGYFSSEEDARAFYHEIYWMLAMQIAAPNSPQWFNTGLWWAYGIEGSDSGQWRCDPKTGEPIQLKNSYEYPQVHACFINSISDNLVEENGIFDLLSREARIFKYGSGAGSNFSKLRGKGEQLSGGGKSSGLMSFLDIFDKAAGAIQSGGTTRRAAKMCVLDMDHPEIEEFIDWKVTEEAKAASMFVGSMVINGEGYQHRDIIPKAIRDRLGIGFDKGQFTEFPVFELGWESEALRTVGGQNSNNSVRLTNSFMECLETSETTTWNLRSRTNGEIVKRVDPKKLWEKLCYAAWACADPGVQYHDNINLYNTCKEDGEIISTNPCGEYNFLDDTACNLASINLVKALLSDPNRHLDWESFWHATELWLIVLDISVSMASFPSKEIAIGSWKYRTTGLGYANLGALLMRLGIPYDSNDARTLASRITDNMHAYSYLTSAKLADELGAFPRWKYNCKPMADVINLHAEHSTNRNHGLVDIWAEIKSSSLTGFRNAQTTLIAPTGTISFVMDCDTTGIEPDFALVKLKALAGGGTMNIVNQSVEPALKTLGYDPEAISDILKFIETHNRFPTTAESSRPMDDAVREVFACGNEISIDGHLKMMAEVQPFLSGAISKTVALPATATVSDIDETYRKAWKLGLKCIALYRDGSKLTQPLSSEQPKPEPTSQTPKRAPIVENIVLTPFSDPIWATPQDNNPNSEAVLDLALRGIRLPLPAKRYGYCRKLSVNEHSIFIHTGEYADGRLGEIFLELSREGSTLRAFANAFAIAISLGLQYGVPLEEFVDAFVHTKFEPAGLVTGHESIKLCSSILDLVIRELAITYLGRTDLANVQESNVAVSVAVETVSKISETHETVQYKIVASGDVCWECGNATLVRTGTCTTCSHCGANSGCG